MLLASKVNGGWRMTNEWKLSFLTEAEAERGRDEREVERV